MVSPEFPTAESPTVLIVDDNRPLAEGFARALSGECEVLTAHSGEEARAAFHDGVDAVLLDRRLPDASGDELLDEFRASDCDCRVAVVSAVTPTEQSADLDCDAYLTKPLAGTEVVREAVADLLDGNVST